jgi:hypothetical protein
MKRPVVVAGVVVGLLCVLGAGAARAQSAFAAAGVVESTQGGFRFPDGSLQLTAAEGGPLENVIRVSPSGGDFSSVEDALASIVAPSATNRFLVDVWPGEYQETGLLSVPGYVHVRGAGPNATRITSSRTHSSPTGDAAVLMLANLGRVSDLALRNTGTSGNFAIGIYSSFATRETVVDNVTIVVDGAGGVGHYAMYLNDSEPTIDRSTLRASGAPGSGTSVNAGIGLVNVSGGFPRPLVRNSLLNGGNGTDLDCGGASGTGFGVQAVSAAPVIVGSVVCGDLRAMAVYTAGSPQVQGSVLRVGGSTGAFLVETSGSVGFLVATSGVFHAGNVETGAGSITCTQSYKSNYTDANATCG